MDSPYLSAQGHVFAALESLEKARLGLDTASQLSGMNKQLYEAIELVCKAGMTAEKAEEIVSFLVGYQINVNAD